MRSTLCLVALVILVAAFALGIWYVAWWTIPFIGGAWALARRSRRAPLEASIAVLVAEGALLLPALRSSTFSTLLDQLGGVFPVSGAGVVGVTLLLAFVLAYSSARVVLGMVGIVEQNPRKRRTTS